MESTIKSVLIKKKVNETPLKILFQSWIMIPHSYAVVNCFQLIHLYKNYGPDGKIHRNKIIFYVEEMPYYRSDWNDTKKLVYNKEYNDILLNFPKYNGETVDLIYRLMYPYNITIDNKNVNIPKCVFYTSEFRDYLTMDYFAINVPNNIKLNDNYIENYLEKFNNIYFTSPSDWSSKGMVKYSIPTNRNRVITHGVDSSIFKMDKTNRKNIREKYNIKDTDILCLCIGAMTTNKGIILILQILNVLVHQLKKSNYKLLLKGTGDLYQCKLFLEKYFEDIVQAGAITQLEMDNLYNNNIIFTEKTLGYNVMNDLYNSADLYLAPYLAEGFCLVPLECLAAGCDVLLPQTGSTKEYAEDIYNNGGSEYIHYTNSRVIQLENGMCQNSIELQDLLNTILLFESKLQVRRNTSDSRNYIKMKEYIEKEYSWNKVSELMVDYFEDIIYHKLLD